MSAGESGAGIAARVICGCIIGLSVPVDMHVCFGIGTGLKYFACFDQGPSFYH